MYVGLQIPSFKYPGGTAAIRPKLKEIVTTAEEAGFHSLWVMDHYYQIKGLFGEAYTDPMMEAYTTLGYVAGLTEKVYLGVLVTGVIYRHPSAQCIFPGMILSIASYVVSRSSLRWDSHTQYSICRMCTK